jgi:hypothetical protein
MLHPSPRTRLGNTKIVDNNTETQLKVNPDKQEMQRSLDANAIVVTTSSQTINRAEHEYPRVVLAFNTTEAA